MKRSYVVVRLNMDFDILYTVPESIDTEESIICDCFDTLGAAKEYARYCIRCDRDELSETLHHINEIKAKELKGW